MFCFLGISSVYQSPLVRSYSLSHVISAIETSSESIHLREYKHYSLQQISFICARKIPTTNLKLLHYCWWEFSEAPAVPKKQVFTG